MKNSSTVPIENIISHFTSTRAEVGVSKNYLILNLVGFIRICCILLYSTVLPDFLYCGYCLPSLHYISLDINLYRTLYSFGVSLPAEVHFAKSLNI